MKADLYVQGLFWATVDVPDDGLLAMLADGTLTHATERASQLQHDFDNIDGIKCSISLRFSEPVADPSDTAEP